MKEIVYDKFCDVTTGILLAKNHPLTTKENLETEDLKDETFLLPCPSDSPGRKEELELILKKLNLKYKDIVYRENAESVTLNIRSGKGVALLDTSIAAVSDESRYKFFPISKDVAPLSLVYAWRIDNVNSALDQFINTLFIKEHIDVFHH